MRNFKIKNSWSWVWGWLWLACLTVNTHARVVINEIFYHAPGDLEDLAYIELHNSGAAPVDLSGWSFAKGIRFTFAAGTRLESGGFLVLCRNADRFKEYYDVPVAGVFNQALSGKGERITLADAAGQVVDTVKYQDSSPWPLGADGFSGSLERICPEAEGDTADNWASSPLSVGRTKPSGTPGKTNSNYSTILPPIITNVRFLPRYPRPGQAVQVEVKVSDPKGLREVQLIYRLAGPGFEKPEVILPMKSTTAGHYSAEIPGQDKDQIIRFRIQASNQDGARRIYPAENEPRPALSCYVHEPVTAGAIPFGWIIDTTEREFKAGQQRAREPGFGGFGPMRFIMAPEGEGGMPGEFPPGGPEPEIQARVQARAQLENGLDLAPAWYELTIRRPIELRAIPVLKDIFAAKQMDRDRVLDDVLEAPKIQEKIDRLPDIVKKFHLSLADALKAVLPTDQGKSMSQWLGQFPLTNALRPGMLFGNPSAVVRGWVKLEEAWFALTARGEFDSKRFAEMRSLFQSLDKERSELVTAVAGLRENENGLRQLRDRGDALEEKMMAGLKPMLTPAQEKQLADWQRGPGPTRGGPPNLVIDGNPERIPMDGPMGFPGGGPAAFGRFRPGPGGFGSPVADPASGRSAFVYFEPGSGEIEFYDFVEVVPRKGGQKIHFHKDHPFHGMTTVNLIFESESAALVEPLAYEVFRKVGVAAPLSYHVRLWIDGQPAGYNLLIEQINRAFLRRNQVDDSGNLYKILWYEQDVVGQHEKKTHIHRDHQDIVKLVDDLQKSSGEEQWRIIRENFDVVDVVNYFVACMALSNWDGFFNNYFTYHDTQGTSKWTIYPWDEDQTWGAMGMQLNPENVFYNMPITFGMNGDRPPGQSPGEEAPRQFGFGFGFGGGAFWWRQPGWFSGPLLANPQFRQVFLARMKEVLESVYTESVFLPIINAMGERLQPEVRFRAGLQKNDPERAAQELERNLQAIREHLTKRRQFLLAQDEIKKAGKFIAPDFATTSKAPGKKKKKQD